MGVRHSVWVVRPIVECYVAVATFIFMDKRSCCRKKRFRWSRWHFANFHQSVWKDARCNRQVHDPQRCSWCACWCPVISYMGRCHLIGYRNGFSCWRSCSASVWSSLMPLCIPHTTLTVRCLWDAISCGPFVLHYGSPVPIIPRKPCRGSGACISVETGKMRRRRAKEWPFGFHPVTERRDRWTQYGSRSLWCSVASREYHGFLQHSTTLRMDNTERAWFRQARSSYKQKAAD